MQPKPKIAAFPTRISLSYEDVISRNGFHGVGASQWVRIDLCDRLEQELHDTRRALWMLVHAAGGRVVIGVDEMRAFEAEHSWLNSTSGDDGGMQITTVNHAPPNV